MNIVKWIKKELLLIPFYLFRIFPIDNKKIVVCNYAGREYSGEGKIVVDALLKKRKDLKIIWLSRSCKDKAPKGVKLVKYLSLVSLYHQATAKVWVDNKRKPGYVRKRKGQYYVQTWHGDICIKTVEKDGVKGLTPYYIENAKRDSKMADLFVSGSEWRSCNFRKAFWYTGEIMKCNIYSGFYLPENLSKLKKSVYKYFGEPKDTKFVLYAPTFRNSHSLECYDIDYNRLIANLEEKFGGKWKVLVRLHPNISSSDGQIKYTDKVLNATAYPQINDLIISSEMLISDYSGCMFEGIKNYKVVMLYASDLEDYLSKERDTYFDIRKLPAVLAQNNDELENNILTFDRKEYLKECKKFVKKTGYYENTDVSMLADRICEVCDGKYNK